MVSTTAGATVRHLVSAVFDRAMVVTVSDDSLDQMTLHNLKGASPSGKGRAFIHEYRQFAHFSHIKTLGRFYKNSLFDYLMELHFQKWILYNTNKRISIFVI